MIAEATDALSVPSGQVYTVIGVLWTGLLVLLGLLWDRSKKCEEWRDANEPIIRELMKRAGMAEGVNELVNECPVQGCPWKGRLETYSVQEEYKTARRNKQNPHP